MKPYPTIRLTEYPDKAEIKNQGRASRVGRCDQRSSSTPQSKARARRYWKRVDRAAAQRDIQAD